MIRIFNFEKTFRSSIFYLKLLIKYTVLTLHNCIGLESYVCCIVIVVNAWDPTKTFWTGY